MKSAINKVTGLTAGFTTEWVVKDNGEWRPLTALELSAVEAEYATTSATAIKADKKQSLEASFIDNSKLPVTVGLKSYNGGKESAQALRDYIQLVQESGGTEYQIWDTNNVISVYTLAEANAIKLAVGTAVAQEEFILRNKKNLVDAALTIAEVEAII